MINGNKVFKGKNPYLPLPYTYLPSMIRDVLDARD